MATVSTQPPRAPIEVRAGQQALPERARATLDRAVESLLGKLQRDPRASSERSGLHWRAELEGDSILSSEYLLMKAILGQLDPASAPAPGWAPEPGAPWGNDRATLERICNHLRLVQRDDGTWGQYPGSPPDLSACVKAYAVLKMFGDPSDAPHMVRARERIIGMGGAERINTFSTFFLACLGHVSWDACPAIPPEIVLLPRWFPFHMDKVSAWTRTMLLPLALCSALRPVREVPEAWRIDELFVDPRCRHRLNQGLDREEPIGWKNFFLFVDRALKACQKAGVTPVRRTATKRAEAWILDRVRPETTEGLGAIFPPMVYVQIAFQALGYERTHPVIVEAERQLDAFMIDEPNDDPRLDHVRLEPCFSPVWDTGIALYSLTEAGLSARDDGRIDSVCRWLVEKQVRRTGDWVRNLAPEDRGIRLGVDASAWAFEYRNDWYPDVDDTAMIAKALRRAGDAEGERVNHETARKAVRWILAMQNDDGGWAAFDRTKDRPWMEQVPFADHNAMQDPSCADITGRTIESLVTVGVDPAHPSVRRAVRYVLDHQEPEGCWWGRWGVNYLYGTWQAMGGLHHAGLGHDHPAMSKALAWLRGVQNDDGGFGESANSYLSREHMAQGPSTASQTAWGLMCLLYATTPDDPAVERAVGWLCDHQLAEDKKPFEPSRFVSRDARDPGTEELTPTDWIHDRAGGWNEHWFTGTGFPKVFYLRYNLYRHSFPVMALARYLNERAGVTVGRG